MVHTFDQPIVRVGRNPDCECRLDEPELADCHFQIITDATHGSQTLRAEARCDVFINNEGLTAGELELHSGDEIRVGHWTFRFTRLYMSARRARSSDLLSLVAKVLVCMILVVEVGLVVWLPQRLQSINLWQNEVHKQRITFLLDRLRRENNDAQPRGDLEAAARQVLSSQLDHVARYVRKYESNFTRKHWQLISDDLQKYEKNMIRLRNGTAFKTIPRLSLELGVQRVIGEKGKESSQP